MVPLLKIVIFFLSFFFCILLHTGAKYGIRCAAKLALLHICVHTKVTLHSLLNLLTNPPRYTGLDPELTKSNAMP